MLAGLTAATLIIPGYAAPSDFDPEQPEAPVVQANVGLFSTSDLPGAEDLPEFGSIAMQEGTVTLSQGAVVNTSRTWITSDPEDPLWGALYYTLFNWPLDDPSHNVTLCHPDYHETCVPNPFFQPECATEEPATQRRATYLLNAVYPLRPLEGGGAEVGFVTETRVNMVAFGSIPATATVTLRSPRVDGEVQPMYAHVWQATGGMHTYPGCDPDFSIPYVSSLVEGEVEIWLSDLEVDGVPVDLGTECRTERSAEVWLWGETALGSYSPNFGGFVGAYDGLHPGSTIPLDHPMYQGRFDGRDIPPSTGIEIPPFTGCGAGGDDLSALVTAMASGPNNPVRVIQNPLNPFFDSMPLDDLTRCGDFGTCPLPGPDLPDLPPLPWEDSP